MLGAEEVMKQLFSLSEEETTIAIEGGQELSKELRKHVAGWAQGHFEDDRLGLAATLYAATELYIVVVEFIRSEKDELERGGENVDTGISSGSNSTSSGLPDN